MSSLTVYSVSFFNGDEVLGSVWEDLEKANIFIAECVLEFENEDPPSDEYETMWDHLSLGEWRGEPTFIAGREGICFLTCYKTKLKLG